MILKKQNILFFTRTMALGGTENVILQLCEIFKPHVNNIVVCSCGGVNVEKLNKMGIKHYNISDIENKSIKRIYSNLKILKNIIKKEKITIIHSHHRMAAMYANLLLDKKIIKIVNAHNTFYNKKLFTKIAYMNTHIIAVGEMVKQNLIDYFGINDKNIKVIHNAIKPFNNKIAEDKIIQQYKKDGYILIGNVGRLSKQKGMSYFIEAASIIKNRSNQKVKYFIVGSGEEEKKLKSLVIDKKLENDIIFLGYRNDIQNIFSQMDFAVLSSLWEGLPLTPIEAFSVGKTIVATSVDGTLEIVKNNKNGILVPSKDSNALADKMELLINNPKEIERLSKNAIKTYKNEFSFDILSNDYLNYYNSL